MACFIAPAAVAVATTVVERYTKKRVHSKAGGEVTATQGRWSQRLRWLSAMMWTGTVLLVIEHALHGELTIAPPFFTALQTPGQLGPMLQEIATAGVAIVVGVVVLWGLLIAMVEQRSCSRALRSERDVA